VGVNIDITPRVFNNREIGLKLSLDVSSVTGSSTIGGVTQPIISQRKIEHDIRLKEGEVNLLGGIFENTDTKSVQGLPGLANLPFLKYLFSDQRTEHIENEIVFVLIPRIVRGQDLTQQNLRAIDVGTANTIDIRRVSSRPATPVTPAPQSPVQIQPQNPPAPAPTATGIQPQSSTAQTQASSAMAATSTTGAPAQLRFEPGTAQQNVGSTFNVQLVVNNVSDLYSTPMQIHFDPKMLQVTSVSAGDFLSRDGQPVALVHREDPATGVISFTATRPPGTGGISGSGVLLTMTFQAKAPGQSSIVVARPGGQSSTRAPITMTSANTTITVK
jgi:general secretion pathway protein D